ncbi:hypothetical protein PN498_18400 [Oscillatoria sp. CS-180]|uniref:hypothetical protein n=1 Tax=Oscillatoria sp. CS-180 TaxID=3021720 RepID=UPI00232BF4B6|nr:hypothetical protein [Oscillatoria sp. CS-180]MDB9527971.1 hypothetical protein [Oscillatoria sp. CS-180]
MVSQPSRPSQASPMKSLVAGGVIIAATLVLVDVQNMRSWLSRSQTSVNEKACEEFVQTEATLSRQQLAELLTIPERDSKERVRQVVAEPYCRMAGLSVRAGVKAEREAYPLEFDPKTQLVILYEDNEYAGYRFNFE